jgi:hypothetical protein
MSERWPPPGDRLLSNVEYDTNGGCWLWAGCDVTSGYGRLFVNGKRVGAHRLSWEVHRGPIPDGLFVCHRCDVRQCCNPDHLFLGTAAENIRDTYAKGRGVNNRGSRSGSAKLTEGLAKRVAAALADGEEQSAVARRFGVTQSAVSRIRLGRAWSEVTGIEPSTPNRRKSGPTQELEAALLRLLDMAQAGAERFEFPADHPITVARRLLRPWWASRDETGITPEMRAVLNRQGGIE